MAGVNAGHKTGHKKGQHVAGLSARIRGATF